MKSSRTDWRRNIRLAVLLAGVAALGPTLAVAAAARHGHVVPPPVPANLEVGKGHGTGDVSRYLPALQRPHGRIHFAGEHTSILHATMEGALRSGSGRHGR